MEVLGDEPASEAVFAGFAEDFGEVAAFAGEVLEFVDVEVERSLFLGWLVDAALCGGPGLGDDDASEDVGDCFSDVSFLDVGEDDFLVVDGVSEIEAALFGGDDPADGGVHHEVIEAAL